ncbi:molybdopterin-guanine dinucleotide biosynthesis protein B [Methylorubrum extorquens]|uniref:Molybdopterin-guanine dinucleotide biosynthesis protein B n=1 Tax=Methylorubrum extorquens TaxID=408 RepID=A0AAX3W984_METEX|nr:MULTISPECIES: molybdopterin-guanine dinucleotide biosynthesis protein B [Methylobacteriaceae]KQO95259.1 molybdopterin-guanine dinucleotide biosynthesis protein MobB [Methylobacterium sp. Leaf92]KQQ04909.1 molybdopterin-guanine dinucleotide biosynthesis protein MobB [Methylobacterium sp. Leaf122]WHQ67882.1 molybdopterin-guanine dinucleotide biosynthesis protein B [Methylorubrum extorquens]
MSDLRVIGLAGWSGAGKTTLLARLIPVLVARGMRVATLKHAHHAFDIDQPGKDSFVHRQAGASEVIVSSARRWAQIREVGEGAEATLPELLRRLTPTGLALVEGFKREAHPKLEVFRAANGRPPLHGDDPRIVGIASDVPFPQAAVPVVGLDDVEAIADLVTARAEAVETVLARLERS